MSGTNDGGPAFPVITNGDTCTAGPWASSPGMSLRDHFAGQAMQAMVGSFRSVMRGKEDAQSDAEPDIMTTDRDMILDVNGVTGGYDGAYEIASDAYIIADAMLAAREARR